tara:strand:- start:22841 stop:23635 length:795 start_codon:yes stop_codon:yes gene_type:complete
VTQSRDLSVLIPFYNEAGNVLPLLDEIHGALAGIDYEIVCVNDCSADTTAAELEEARTAHPDRVIVRTHVVRAGKSAALMTGLREVNGRWTQLLDGDGQNDIADTKRLWTEIVAPGNTGRLGLIAGKRNSRNDSGFKWLQSRVANGVRRFMLRDDATDTGCGWKLMRTDAFRELPYFASMHRFLPALMKRAGWEVREERVNDRRRWHGSSKYGFLGRLGAGTGDLVGMFWLVRRGQPGIAAEWNDPRAPFYMKEAQPSEAKKSS